MTPRELMKATIHFSNNSLTAPVVLHTPSLEQGDPSAVGTYIDAWGLHLRSL